MDENNTVNDIIYKSITILHKCISMRTKSMCTLHCCRIIAEASKYKNCATHQVLQNNVSHIRYDDFSRVDQMLFFSKTKL